MVKVVLADLTRANRCTNSWLVAGQVSQVHLVYNPFTGLENFYLSLCLSPSSSSSPQFSSTLWSIFLLYLPVLLLSLILPTSPSLSISLARFALYRWLLVCLLESRWCNLKTCSFFFFPYNGTREFSEKREKLSSRTQFC